MKKHVRAFLDKYRAAIITVLILCFGFISQAQVYQQLNQYGVEFKRVRPTILLGTPIDTFPVPAGLQDYSHIAIRPPDSMYVWNTTDHVWQFFQPGGGIDSVTNDTDSSRIWQGGVYFGIPRGGFFSPDQESSGNTYHNAKGYNYTIDSAGVYRINHATSFQARAPYWDDFGGGLIGVDSLNVAVQVARNSNNRAGFVVLIDENEKYNAIFDATDSVKLIFPGPLVDITDSADYYMLVISKNGFGHLAKAPWPTETGGSVGGISEVIAGFGLININDSTLAVDTANADLKAWTELYGGVDSYTSMRSIDDTTFALLRGDLSEDTVVIRGSTDITLPADIVYEDSVQALTNKRWTARVGSTTSSATPTINTDNYDIYKLTAQAADITSFTTNLTGSPTDGQILEIQITGTAARAITWGSSFVASTVNLPSTTDSTNTLTVVFQYFTTSSYGNNKFVCVNSF